MTKPILPILLFLALMACKRNPQYTTPLGLSYPQLREMVLENTGESIEWHGESLENSLRDSLKITEGPSCGAGSCGKSLSLKNTSQQTVEVIIQAPFQYQDFSSYMASKHLIAPGEAQSIGCSHLCHEGKIVKFARKIIGSRPR